MKKMSRTLIFGFLLVFILENFAKTNCAPLVSDVEREESAGKQLDFPNENEIPGQTVPRSDGTPYIPRQYPGSPRRQSTGLINRIVNFFKNMLGLGTPAYGPDGEPTDASNPGESGILSFIRRTFGGLINRFMSILGNGSQGPSVNPDAAEFPYQRPRQEPLRSRS